jgi:tRNA(Ile)-lysidine synthase TilS/MesJ
MQSNVKCSKCGNKSVYFQKSSGRNLCRDCYVSYFERKFQKTMSKYIPLDSSDVICVGLSGGKDSISLLYNLHLRQLKTKTPKLIAVTIDEGISSNFKYNQNAIHTFFEEHNIHIPLIKASFKESFGLTMDEIVKIMHSKKLKLNACTVCASIRRRVINEVAKKNDATLIAIGHNLDDLAQTFLMNVLRNDLEKISKNPPFSSMKGDSHLLLPRIKPLFLMTEEEIVRYCAAKPLPHFSTTCINAVNFPILRKKVQYFLNGLDERSYELKYNLIKLHVQLSRSESSQQSSIAMNFCSSCGYPTGLNRDICTYCEFKQIFTAL